MITIEKLKICIVELGRIRGVPQFLFCDGIHSSSMHTVRQAVGELKRAFPDCSEIDFIINSPGGSPPDAYRIIRTLRSNFETVNVVVPFWAKSAATLLSLGGSRIIMDEFGEFGPLDMQLSKEREDSFNFESESALVDEHSLKRIEIRARHLFLSMFLDLHGNENIPIPKQKLSKQLFSYVSDFYTPLLQQINPYQLGEKKRKLDIGEHYARRILALYNPEIGAEQANLLVDYLVNGCPDHGFAIDYSVVSIFMPNVFLADTFGLEYKEQLEKLSNLFIDFDGTYEYVGFVRGILEEDHHEPNGKVNQCSQDGPHPELERLDTQ